MKFLNKVVLIAGAGSSGPGWSIGKATCATLARQGATILALDASAAAAEDACEEARRAGGTAVPLVADVADAAGIADVARYAETHFGGVDAYIANAGIGKRGGIADTTLEDFERIQQVNVHSLLIAAKLLIPAMLARGGGSIVTVSSVAGMRYAGYPHLSYSVTKAALIHFTRLIAHEYAEQNIRANTVVPGLIDTPRINVNVAGAYTNSGNLDEMREKRNQQVPMRRMGTPWEVANAIAFLVSDDASYVTGTELIVDGGLTGKF